MKIEELVGEGVKTVDEMKRYLRQSVKMELFPGPGKLHQHQQTDAITQQMWMSGTTCIRHH